jgi:hypothetical protein
MERTKIDAPAALPTLAEQQLKKHGRNFHCKDCFHSYLVSPGIGQPPARGCFFGPAAVQLVGPGAVTNVPRVVGDFAFCHQFKDAVLS